MMNRVSFLRGVMLSARCWAGSLLATTAERPNVVFLLSDAFLITHIQPSLLVFRDTYNE